MCGDATGHAGRCQPTKWYAHGGYEPIAEKLFGSLIVDRLLLLDYDTERMGTLAPLRFVRADTIVVLGLVSTKVLSLERRDDPLRRIEEAATYVPVEGLLSPQCGFASTAGGNLLTEDEQWPKLELVVEAARQVWGQTPRRRR